MPETCATKIAATERYSELPVEVEAVAGGDDERDDLPRNADGLHRFHGARQRGLGAGSAEGDGHRLGHGLEEAPQRHAEHQRDGQQNAEDEDDQRGIQRQQQLQQAAQHGQVRYVPQCRPRPRRRRAAPCTSRCW